MRDITVILTSVGGPVGPSYINCLKMVKERNINIIGVDANEENAAHFLVDKFEKVPLASNEEEYIQHMIAIAQKNKVDAIVPASDIESLVLSKNRENFEKIGTQIICSDYEAVKLSSDKFLFCKMLQENGIPTPKIYSVKTVEQLREAAQKLGYPSKPVVMKPRFAANGGRGMRILDENKNRKDILFGEKPDGNIFSTVEEMEKILQGNDFPELVISEYLSKGLDYDVDILTHNGNMLICVPKKRIKKIIGLSLVAEIDLDEEIEDLCRRICKVFNFNYNINIECKRSENDKMIPFEINPRIAATISLPVASGVNLIYFGIKLGIGEEIPKFEINNKTKIFRHLQGVFVKNDEEYITSL